MFTFLINKLEPGVHLNQILNIYKKSLEAQENVTLEIFRKVISDHKIGGYGNLFFTNYL